MKKFKNRVAGLGLGLVLMVPVLYITTSPVNVMAGLPVSTVMNSSITEIGSTSGIIKATGITFRSIPSKLYVGYVSQLRVTVSPSNATNKNVIYSSSDTSVASISSTGRITGIKEGTVTITAKALDGEFTTSKTVNVVMNSIKVTSVNFSTIPSKLYVGYGSQLSTKVYPSSATNKNVIITSSDPSVASISTTDYITGNKEGTVTITAKTLDGGFTTSKTITVVSNTIKATSVNFSHIPSKLYAGYVSQLKVTVSPSNATNKDVTYTSSDTSVASISNTGRITGIKAGTVTITAKTLDGGFTTSKTITVV